MLKLVAHKVTPRLSMVNVDISIHTAWSLQSSSVTAETEGYMKVSGSRSLMIGCSAKS